MFASCCVCLVLVLYGFGSGLLAHCVCTHAFVAVLEFVFAFFSLWCVVAVSVFVVVRCFRICFRCL
jgi:hypothetical protein